MKIENKFILIKRVNKLALKTSLSPYSVLFTEYSILIYLSYVFIEYLGLHQLQCTRWLDITFGG